MPFEVFKKQFARATKYEEFYDKIAVVVNTKNREIGLMPAAHAAIGKPKYAELLLDEQAGLLAIKPTATRTGFTIHDKQGSSKGRIQRIACAVLVRKLFGQNKYDQSILYASVIDGMLVIDYKQKPEQIKE